MKRKSEGSNKMKSKQSSKKAKAESANLVPPGTPDNQKSTSTPHASPAGSTSSTSSLISASSAGYTRPAILDQAGIVAGSSGAASSSKSSNAKSKGASAAKEVDKGAGALPKSSYPTLSSVTHFDLVNFPKINVILSGNKTGTAGGQASTTSTSNASTFPSTVASALGLVGEANKSTENLSMDDVDMLQAELETLWSSVAVRIRTLNREIGGLQTPSTSTHHNLGLEHFDPQHQEKIAAVATIIDHGTRTSVSAAAKLVMGAQLGASSPLPSPAPSTSAAVTPTTKKSGNAKGERQPKKKVKGEGSGIGKSKKGGDKPAARATQNRSHSVSSDIGADGIIKHHEVPNQFWDSMDSYFRDITSEDLDVLNGIIQEHNNLPEDIFNIPPLGKHYKDDEETAKKKAKEQQANSGKDQIGPLAQRLVSALVDERVAMCQSNQLNSPKEEAASGSSSSSNLPEGGFIHRPGLARVLGLDGPSGPATASTSSAAASGECLESKIRDCLLENGLLSAADVNDQLGSDPEDEILAEILRTQQQLRKLHQYNSQVLQRFVSIGQQEYERQTYQRDLDKADRDVMDAYKSISQLRLKKKPVTKKDKDLAFKALEARKKALANLQAHGRSRNDLSPTPGPSSAAGSSSDPTAALRVQV